MQDEITLRSAATGRETTASTSVWIKCLLEMLPGSQLAELVRRVEVAKGASLVVPAGPRHYRMLAEPGEIGLRGARLGG
jgi:hypothetical protein